MFKIYTIKTATEELKISLSELIMRFRAYLRSNDEEYNIGNSYQIVELFLKNEYNGYIKNHFESLCLREDLREIKWEIINEQADAI